MLDNQAKATEKIFIKDSEEFEAKWQETLEGVEISEEGYLKVVITKTGKLMCGMHVSNKTFFAMITALYESNPEAFREMAISLISRSLVEEIFKTINENSGI